MTLKYALKWSFMTAIFQTTVEKHYHYLFENAPWHYEVCIMENVNMVGKNVLEMNIFHKEKN